MVIFFLKCTIKQAIKLKQKVYDVNNRNVLFSTDKTEVMGSQFPEKAKEAAVREAAKQVGEVLLRWINGNI